MPRKTKLNTYERKTGANGRNARHSIPSGVFRSRTMIVIRIAMTPSLKASSRPLCTVLSPRQTLHSKKRQDNATTNHESLRHNYLIILCLRVMLRVQIDEKEG